MSYLYYLCYKFVLNTPSRNELPQHIAVILFSIVLTFSIIGIMKFLESFDLLSSKGLFNKIEFLIPTYLIFLLLGYFFIVKNEKYILIKEKYDSQTIYSRAWKTSTVIVYLIALIIILFFV